MCGIVGIVRAPGDLVAAQLYDSLVVLQHRGQDAAGIVTSDENNMCHRRATGMVRDVFQAKHMMRLTGSMGIGHVRYPTAGGTNAAEVQPFYSNVPFGVSLAHNGNLNNKETLIRTLLEENHRRVNTSSDSEALLNVFAAELTNACAGRKNGLSDITDEDVFTAVTKTHERLEGSYAFVALITGWGMVGVRDPHGIRPLCLGKNEIAGVFTEQVLASESVVYKSLGFKRVRDVAPGEAIVVRADGTFSSRVCCESPSLTPCIFEYVYFARPDSTIDGISVHSARLRMGTALGKQILANMPEGGIDVVIPVPDSGRTAALELAREIGVPYREGFVKNRYIGRTFIMPGNQDRIDSVRKKLNTVEEEFDGKSVLIVDDSVVRGNTSRRIIAMARQAKATKVYFASAAPPIMYPNVYGIDMPANKEFVAHGRTMTQIAYHLEVDGLYYQNLDDLIECCRHPVNQDPTVAAQFASEFDCACFDGKYVTGTITPEYLASIEKLRNDAAKKT